LGGERSLRLDGRHYRLSAPPPMHRIELWIGGYRPRMLRLTGRLGGGWLPSAGYLDLEDARASQRVIDEAARSAGREPDDVRRVLNAGVQGSSGGWADQLARIAINHRFNTILVSVPGDDPVGFIRRLGEEAARAARDKVAQAGS
jgi:hypothetical protein